MSTRVATPADFPWTGDAARWSWLAERIEGDHGERTDPALIDPATGEPLPELSHVVPSGYEALVRILHPFARSRPASGTWDEYRDAMRSEDPERWPESVSEDAVRWAAVAEAHGRALEPGSLSYDLLGIAYGEQPEGEAPDGWSYELPLEGSPDEREFIAAMAILAAHTATPDRGIAAAWEGVGGLLSAQGVGFYIGFAADGDERGPRWWRSLALTVRGRRAAFEAFRGRFGTGPAIRNLLQQSFTWGRGRFRFVPRAFDQLSGAGNGGAAVRRPTEPGGSTPRSRTSARRAAPRRPTRPR